VLRQLRAINPTSQDASMGLGIFALLDGRIEESRAHFQDVTRRNARRSQAELMLAFIEGSLPEDEHLRLCEALGTLTTGSTTIDACQAETR
jgi:hypothetical protein